ncbi:MAG: hypothetical protein GXY44_00590 [Phycisphaerales bacterium]|nr:hypothetical protein [Phycisphaerales bacterium]
MLELSGQFVLLEHVLDAGRHWDLMFEAGSVLVTWQLAHNPIVKAASAEAPPISACRIVDHRRTYLDYQGRISGDRGSVTRLDKGQYFLIGHEPDRLSLDIRGEQLCGHYEIIKSVSNEAVGGDEVWRFVRQHD